MLEVAGVGWDARPGGRTSPSDAFGPVPVFGDNPPVQGGASAAGASAAAAELPAAEVPRPDDDWANIANTPITASGRRMHITGEEVRCFGGL